MWIAGQDPSPLPHGCGIDQGIPHSPIAFMPEPGPLDGNLFINLIAEK